MYNHIINYYLHNNALSFINNTTLNLELKKFMNQSNVGPFDSGMFNCFTSKTLLQSTV